MTTQSSASSSLCIYCEESGPFSKEHVITAGLGGDDKRFMLVEMVCKRCNTDILGKLELEMLRSSPIGIGRAFFQPHGRDRGKHTTAPGIQARRKLIVNASGYPDEVDFGPHAKPVVLPQLKITGEKSFTSTAAGPDELRSFVTTLSALFQSHQITCIRKRGPEHQLRYEAIIMRRSDKTFIQTESSFQAKPPRGGIWLERYDETDAEDVTPAATILQKLDGGVVLKTSSATVEDALDFFAQAVEQFSYDSQVTMEIEGPIVSVGMTTTVGVMERVIAKIGINLLAHYLGRDYVTDPGFRQIKDSILTGTPHVLGALVENDRIKQLLNAAPDHHHVFYLNRTRQPGGRAAVTMIAHLYGVPQWIRLALDAPEPHLPFPVFFLVDYVNHEVKQQSEAEYAETLPDTWAE